jgi:hypothetical protein
LSLEAAYHEAEKRLMGSFAQGKYDAIKKSFLRVRKDLEDPKKRLNYYRATREVQELTDTTPPLVVKKPMVLISLGQEQE